MEEARVERPSPSNRARFGKIAVAACVILAPGTTNAWDSSYKSGHLSYTSAKLVFGLKGDVSSVTPAVDDSKIPGAPASFYLGSSSCLGHFGPIGAYGPLGTLGPIGSNTWNSSYWMSFYQDEEAWSNSISGSLGADGPLGSKGPVADSQYYGTADPGKTLFANSDFAVQLRALGLWTVLGPIGPLGALGPLGPVGHLNGLPTNDKGQYIKNGKVQRTIAVPYNGSTSRTYELHEFYKDWKWVAAMKDNDTSFTVVGEGDLRGDPNVYRFRSAVDQLVTILVVPEKELDDFDLTIMVDDGSGVKITSNTGYETMDWIQMKVPAGTKLRASVFLDWSGHFLASTYRLMVVGSGSYLNRTEITGKHVSAWR